MLEVLATPHHCQHVRATALTYKCSYLLLFKCSKAQDMYVLKSAYTCTSSEDNITFLHVCFYVYEVWPFHNERTGVLIRNKNKTMRYIIKYFFIKINRNYI